jgi:hypothetical protein
MSTDEDRTAELERRLRALLEESTARVDSRVRSRLARARFAAVEEAGRSPAGFWRTLASSSRTLVPAGAVAAAALVATLLWNHAAEPPFQANESPAAFEDVELLADGEALDLIEEWDLGFYEWAASEADTQGASG